MWQGPEFSVVPVPAARAGRDSWQAGRLRTAVDEAYRWRVMLVLGRRSGRTSQLRIRPRAGHTAGVRNVPVASTCGAPQGKLLSNLDLSIRDVGGHAVVALSGELVLADAPAVASYLMAAAAACGQSIIVDLEGLEYIDSRGLGILLCVRQWARRRGGDLSLAAPQQQVRELLEGCGMTGIFSVSGSVREAASDPGLPFGAELRSRS